MRKFTSDELQQVLHDHARWIKSYGKSGKRADLRGSDLRGCNLRGCDLRGCDLRGCDLHESDLSESDLHGSDLRGSDLRGSDLRGCDLHESDFSGSDLHGSDLSESDLHGSDLRGCKGAFAPMACPSDGAFIAWKKCRDDLIVKLLIPEDARRLSAAGRKCRCDKAEVLEIQNLDGTNAGTTAYSTHNSNFVYVVGQTVTPDRFCDDRWQECSNGIHFFISREEAVQY